VRRGAAGARSADRAKSYQEQRKEGNLNMADKKTAAQLETENAELAAKVATLETQVKQQQTEIDELLTEQPKPRVLIALESRTGQSRNRGGYTIPSGEAIVLDVATIAPEALREIEADPAIAKLRTDTEPSPASAIVTY
jgi:hypothetical protein